ncbi:MAG: hypothetical protein HYT76_08325 [Deltaproteobacteria bacterium]|nr:hypothetical protein [Deltaproteobacteria bacterium]
MKHTLMGLTLVMLLITIAHNAWAPPPRVPSESQNIYFKTADVRLLCHLEDGTDRYNCLGIEEGAPIPTMPTCNNGDTALTEEDHMKAWRKTSAGLRRVRLFPHMEGMSVDDYEEANVRLITVCARTSSIW